MATIDDVKADLDEVKAALEEIKKLLGGGASASAPPLVPPSGTYFVVGGHEVSRLTASHAYPANTNFLIVPLPDAPDR